MLLAALASVAGCELDTSVPNQPAMSGAPASLCELETCEPADASTPNEASMDASLLDAAPPAPTDASRDSGTERCVQGAIDFCYEGPPESMQHPPCAAGTRTCNSDGTWGACEEQVLPSRESCNEIDDDCDGITDEDFDLQSDRGHCGACSQTCAGDDECCAGACVDVRSEPGHCGMCGMACKTAEQCCHGRCVDPQNDRDNCGPSCVKCAADYACCAGTCADLGSFQHCGECGNACNPTSELCCNGTCSSASACGD